MNHQKDLARLGGCIKNFDEDGALKAVDDLLARGADPRAVMNCLSDGLVEVGRMYQAGKCFMAGLMLVGEIMRQALQVLMPFLTRENKTGESGLIVVGTIEGDIHDLGKNLAAYFLEAHGFEVIDLGVDVSPRAFLTEILNSQPDAVGVSLLLVSCITPLNHLSFLIKETFKDRPASAPALFAGCGFLSGNIDDNALLANQDQQKEWMGVDHVVADVYETVKLCQSIVGAKNNNSAVFRGW